MSRTLIENIVPRHAQGNNEHRRKRRPCKEKRNNGKGEEEKQREREKDRDQEKDTITSSIHQQHNPVIIKWIR